MTNIKPPPSYNTIATTLPWKEGKMYNLSRMIFLVWTKLPICNYKTHHLLCLEDGFGEFWSRFDGDAFVGLNLFNLDIISGFQNLKKDLAESKRRILNKDDGQD